MAIDYEKEYDNRGRVPEHPGDLRALAARGRRLSRARARGAELGLAYGPSPRQTLDLFPAMGGNGSHRSRCSSMAAGGARCRPRCSARLAAGPNARGVTVAVAGYDLCPQVTIAAIIEQMRAACLWLWRKHAQAHARLRPFRRRPSRRLHGGDRLEGALRADAPADLVPAAYAISGVFDLVAAAQRVAERGPAARRGRSAARVAALLARCRPDASLDAVVGALEIERIPAPEQDHRRRLAAGQARRRATRRSPAPTISPCSTRSPTRKAR